MHLLQSVEGMKVVCHELAQATSDPDGSAMDELVKDADRLVSCLATKAITSIIMSWCYPPNPCSPLASPLFSYTPVLSWVSILNKILYSLENVFSIQTGSKDFWLQSDRRLFKVL